MSPDTSIKPPRPGRTPKCPICSKPAEARWRPFCSKRCSDVDLGRWLGEGYRVPTNERPAEGQGGEDDT